MAWAARGCVLAYCTVLALAGCPAGYHRDPCVACEVGKFKLETGSSECSFCPPDTYKSHPGPGSCTHDTYFTDFVLPDALVDQDQLALHVVDFLHTIAAGEYSEHDCTFRESVDL